MRHLLSILVAGAVLSVPGVATAQPATDYPSRPIKLVVGFAPGGATDVVARMVTGASNHRGGEKPKGHCPTARHQKAPSSWA